MPDGLTVVCGGGGFIGGHLVRALQRQGRSVRSVDIKPVASWYQRVPGAENLQLDLRERAAASRAVRDAAVVYNLAADMGGMGFIEAHKALCMLNVLINTHLLLAAQAKLSGKHWIEIWGDGEQARSFTYIEDCLEGTQRIPASDVAEPLNLGSSEKVTINQLVDMVEEIAGVSLERSYDLGAPRGMSGRSSDNSLVRARLGWEPSIRLRDGIERTHAWIHDQVKAGAGRPA